MRRHQPPVRSSGDELLLLVGSAVQLSSSGNECQSWVRISLETRGVLQLGRLPVRILLFLESKSAVELSSLGV